MRLGKGSAFMSLQKQTYELIISSLEQGRTCVSRVPIVLRMMGFFCFQAFPVVQCPMGLDSNGLPLGVQLLISMQVVGAPNSDRLLIAAAKDLEEGFGGWVPARPL
uniref:Amidase domain-containing protein n=1 Tax=Heterorhabditis bacteriophora TaxID=37862 RepID=A0A1I7WX65_HETBA